ncbi:MAG TPA: tetratricopeptide repeat protein, partial [Solirubrobacteraceae bacterium]|nr:tetratricopeptide repeat protein [Solirubrobacteraceae bacterium]
AAALQDAGRPAEAIALLEPLVADLERLHGAEHPNTLRTRNNLAIVLLDAGRAEEAIAILEPLVADLERAVGAEHPDTRGSRANLANAYEATGRTEDADRTRRPPGDGSGWDDGDVVDDGNAFIV